MSMMQHDIPERESALRRPGFKSAAKFALLPGIIPLIRRIAERFAHMLHIFTMIFGTVGLIDKDHPCLRVENIGRYRFFDIIGLASHNVRFDKKHLPQAIMFFAVVLGLILVAAFVVTSFFYSTLFISDAHAQATANYFSPPNASGYSRGNDWAFMFLEGTFGKTGIGEHIWALNNSDPAEGASRLQAMLRAMLAHYSVAILVLAVFLVIYLMITTLAETAHTGKPFGQKFNTVWAPIRLVVAIGLLVPISAGYNAAQLIVFQMSDWGSNLATNVWVTGLNEMKEQNYLQAVAPDRGYRFVRGLWLSEVCMAAWNKYNEPTIAAHFMDAALKGVAAGIPGLAPWAAIGGALQASGSATDQMFGVNAALDNMYRELTYGTKADPDFCGRLRMPIPQGDVKVKDLKGNVVVINKFGVEVSKNYAEIVSALVTDVRATAEQFVDKATSDCKWSDIPITDCKHKNWIIDTYWAKMGFDKSLYKEACGTLTPYDMKDDSVKSPKFFQNVPDGPAYQSKIAETNRNILTMIETAYAGGWSSAGAFYMTIAYANGAMYNAIATTPTVLDLPVLLSSQSATPTNSLALSDTFMGTVARWTNPFTAQTEAKAKEAAQKTAQTLVWANQWFASAPTKNTYLMSWLGDSFRSSVSEVDSRASSSQNSDFAVNQRLRPIVYEGWMSIHDGDVNPLGRLVGLGGQFMSWAMILFSIGIAGSTFLAGSSAWGDIFVSLGTLFGMAGFALALYLPLMPFIFFTFAVMEWIMGIMEAIIGMPLWALSMITIEGEGLGRTAESNFKKLIGIMLQPTILVISLIASLILFSTCISFFNKGFSLFTDSYMNTAGSGRSDTVSSLGQLWDEGTSGFVDRWNSGTSAFGASMIGMVSFSFLYAFAAYSIGQSCFKLIPTIANNFMDWYGGAKLFSGIMDAKLAGVNSYVAMGKVSELTKSTMGSSMAVKKGIQDYQEKKDKKKDESKAIQNTWDLMGERGQADFGGKIENFIPHYKQYNSDAAYRKAYDARNAQNNPNINQQARTGRDDDNNTGNNNGGNDTIGSIQPAETNNNPGNAGDTANNLGGTAGPQQATPASNNRSRWTTSTTGNAGLNYTTPRRGNRGRDDDNTRGPNNRDDGNDDDA